MPASEKSRNSSRQLPRSLRHESAGGARPPGGRSVRLNSAPPPFRTIRLWGAVPISASAGSGLILSAASSSAYPGAPAL